VINNEFTDGIVAEHVRGGTKDGTGRKEDRQKEEVIKQANRNDLLGSGRPDLTWEITFPDGSTERVRLNTVDMLKNGDLTAQEKRALDNLQDLIQDELIDTLPKLQPGDDEEEYAKRAREKCRQIFSKYIRASAIR
jgi:hypothetical protein